MDRIKTLLKEYHYNPLHSIKNNNFNKCENIMDYFEKSLGFSPNGLGDSLGVENINKQWLLINEFIEKLPKKEIKFLQNKFL